MTCGDYVAESLPVGFKMYLILSCVFKNKHLFGRCKRVVAAELLACLVSNQKVGGPSQEDSISEFCFGLQY